MIYVNVMCCLQIAITGETFFSASAIATDLIRNNILRIGKVNVIGDVILFLGKLSMSLASALFAFLMLDTHRYKSSHNKVSSPLFPVLVSYYPLLQVNDCTNSGRLALPHSLDTRIHSFITYKDITILGLAKFNTPPLS